MKSKSFVLRIYAVHDADLINLFAHGISMATLARNVLVAYAHNKPLHYALPEMKPIEAFPDKTCRTRFTISDEKTLNLLSQIRDRKINSFVKALIRNALTRQNISVYFEPGSSMYGMEREKNLELASEPDTILLERGRKALTIDDMLESITPPEQKKIKAEKKTEKPKNKHEKPEEENWVDIKNEEPEVKKKKTEEEPLVSEMRDFKIKEEIPHTNETMENASDDQESMNMDMLRMLQDMDKF